MSLVAPLLAVCRFFPLFVSGTVPNDSARAFMLCYRRRKRKKKKKLTRMKKPLYFLLVCKTTFGNFYAWNTQWVLGQNPFLFLSFLLPSAIGSVMGKYRPLDLFCTKTRYSISTALGDVYDVSEMSLHATSSAHTTCHMLANSHHLKVRLAFFIIVLFSVTSAMHVLEKLFRVN